MRIEADYNILSYLAIMLFAVLALAKTNMPRKPYKILLASVTALIMPAFVPGHGEIVMLIPNGALFVVAPSEIMVVGIVFTVINYFIAWFILYKVCGLFNSKK
ncbi:hypothetical protein MNBD_GAMMA02-1528 [hydrothermal vent metagenome]|uniref:Uncharacterized protein n=1 Tax=hydrothermal vent metagenome TaxID=652676 RepID=A0A3B0W0J6_9ZZZZ